MQWLFTYHIYLLLCNVNIVRQCSCYVQVPLNNKESLCSLCNPTIPYYFGLWVQTCPPSLLRYRLMLSKIISYYFLPLSVNTAALRASTITAAQNQSFFLLDHRFCLPISRGIRMKNKKKKIPFPFSMHTLHVLHGQQLHVNV